MVDNFELSFNTGDKTKVHKAEKTLAAIDEAIAADDGAAFRKQLEIFLPLMEDAYRGQGDPFRDHLGASLIGDDCPRRLWQSFRWHTKRKFPPRILRLFNRGHLEEARFLAMLSLIPAIELWYESPEGGQIKFNDINGHFGSALDGVIRGCPDLPSGVPAYTEFKTSSDKIFKKIEANGVQNEKYEHYVQMQICMHEMKLSHALYMVVNKNDDSLYAEIVQYNQQVAVQYLKIAYDIIYDKKPPRRVCPNTSWFKAKFCEESDVCFLKAPPAVNCRTCVYSEPSKTSSDWICNKHGHMIEGPERFKGCDDHCYTEYFIPF